MLHLVETLKQIKEDVSCFLASIYTYTYVPYVPILPVVKFL